MSDFALAGVFFHTPICLAPMAGVTDRSFRRLCLEMGADYLTTEMISAKALCFQDEKTASLAFLGKEEAPIAVQLFGGEPEYVAKAAKMLSEGSYHGCRSEIPPFAIDLNMGCPMKKITGNREGCALMRDLDRAGKIIQAAVRASRVPVTVKMRAGWDDETKNAPALAKIAEEAGAAMICIHGRTREQLYRPPVDLEIIREVKAAVKIPVIGNGGIFSGEDALEMLRRTGCDGVAVGRGAEGNPFIFREIASALAGVPYTPPSEKERLQTAKRHAALLMEEKGEYTGVREFRRHLSFYVKGMRGAAHLREEVCHMESAECLLERLETFEKAL